MGLQLAYQVPTSMHDGVFGECAAGSELGGCFYISWNVKCSFIDPP